MLAEAPLRSCRPWPDAHEKTWTQILLWVQAYGRNFLLVLYLFPCTVCSTSSALLKVSVLEFFI
jgi:hypothetical protein